MKTNCKIAFVRRNNLIGKIIRYFDKGEYSHVGIVLPYDRVLDARLSKGVQIRKNDYKDYDVVEVGGNLENAMRLIGYRYDRRLIIRLALRYFLSKLGVTYKIHNSPKEIICSELISYFLEREDLRNVTPNELHTVLTKLNKE